MKSVKIKLLEKTTTTVKNETREQTREVASVAIDTLFEIKDGESRAILFKLPVNLSGKASLDLFGGKLEISIGSSSQPLVLELVATVDLEGVTLDPTASKYVRFMN